jgi:hypothetical protein
MRRHYLSARYEKLSVERRFILGWWSAVRKFGA